MSAAARARLLDEAAVMRSQYVRRGIRDITQPFTDACGLLHQGELVKDEFFTLFEAVGALEIMDLKMDTGYVPLGESVESDFDVAKGISAPKVLWIMDELFRLETIFHDGYPLSQTIFTSLHVFRLVSPTNTYPYNLELKNPTPETHLSNDEILVHQILRAYCIGIIKSVQSVLRLIQSNLSFEEEDFVTYLFGRDLLLNLEFTEAVELITTAMNCIETLHIDQDVKYAIRKRLEIRREILFALEQGGVQRWGRLKNLIPEMAHSNDMAEAMTEAFSDKVQRQLATSTPPRPLAVVSPAVSHDKWLRLCDDVLAALSLTSSRVRHNPSTLRRAAWAFAYRDPPPSTYARAKMQDLLVADDKVAGEVPQFDLFLADIRDLVLAGDPLADLASFQVDDTSDPRFRVSRIIEDFMSKGFNEYLNLYRIICLNRCRTRRQLTQLLPLVVELEAEASNTDDEMSKYIEPRQAADGTGQMHRLKALALWTNIYKGGIVEWIIQLGFETDLYLSDEMSTMYMVLAEALDSNLGALRRSEFFASDRLQKLRHAGPAHYVEECEGALEFLASRIAQTQISWFLARTLSDIYAFLERNEVIQAKVKSPFEASLRYEARMKPLLRAEPARWANISQIATMKDDRTRSVDAICEAATDAMKQTKTLIGQVKSYSAMQARYAGTEEQWIKEIKQLEKVCIAIGVTASQLLAICQKHNSNLDRGDLRKCVALKIPPPGERYHDWWVVPRIQDTTGV